VQGPGPDLRARFAAAGVPARPLALALRAYACANARGEISSPILTLIDYSRPSTQPRLWVLDLEQGVVRFRTLVAHGRGSGLARAVAFSNLPDSKQSSLGLFRTDEIYEGSHGYSLRLTGLEAGVNDLAYSRNIVIHGADYATAKFASRHGRLGRSWGCPALDPAVHREVIDTIRGGTALFAYYPDAHWLATSQYLH
jgi:L,D-transpeptidase catalytic domain